MKFTAFLCCLVFIMTPAISQAAPDYVPVKTQAESEAYPPLQLTPDNPAILKLDKDIANIVIGNEKHVSIVPDTARSVVVVPRQPGATSFKLLDAGGNIIMERGVIVAAPRQDYIRVRRACPSNKPDCVPYSVYYCPDMCHEVAVERAPAAATIEKPTGGLPEMPALATDVSAEPLPTPPVATEAAPVEEEEAPASDEPVE